MSRLIVRARELDLQQWLLLAISLALVAIGSISAVRIFETSLQEKLQNSLVTMRDSMEKSLLVWHREHQLAVQNLAAASLVREAAEELIAYTGSTDRLVDAEALQTLREYFALYLQTGQYHGFFIIGPGNVNLASSRNENLGNINLLTEEPDILERMWAGEAVMGRVQYSDVPLPDFQNLHGHLHYETLFVGAPVRANDGQLVALLTLRIDPYSTLFPILQQGRPGETGETYSFNRKGMVLSPLRFEDDLVEQGRLKPDEHSPLRVKLVNPNAQAAEMTFMANEAIAGRAGSRVEPYFDYRGVPVVGAWKWLDSANIGLVVEQDASEAYSLLYMVRFLTYGGGVLVSLLMILVALALMKGRRQVMQSQRHFNAVAEAANDSIVIIDSKGIIQNINPAVEAMFGYKREEVVGKNVTCLMPERHRARHGGYIRNYLDSGIPKIIGKGTEEEARRSDGSLFPAEFSISRMELDSGTYFAGIIRDISQRKEHELQLELQKNFSRSVVDALATQLLVLDHECNIVFMNRSWKEYQELADSGDAGLDIGVNYIDLAEQEGHKVVEEPQQAVTNLRSMLTGELGGFQMEYPVEKSGVRLWFKLNATRFENQGEIRVVWARQDVTARVEAERMVKEEQKVIESVNQILSLTTSAMDRTGIAEFWVDAEEGFIRLASDHACKHLGIARGQLLQMSFMNTLHGMTARQFEQQMAGVRENGWGRFEAVQLSRQNGQIPVEITAMYQAEDESRDAFYICFVTDISNRKKVESELIRAREEAEAANKAKSTFLAIMSHEIRTPLNGVVGTIDMMGHGTLDQSQREMLKTAETSAVMLQTVIDDILDFSKIEAGRMDLESVPVDLCELVEGLGDSLLPMAFDKGVEFLVYCDPKIPGLIGDPVRIRQILYNLAGNAIKFSANKKDKSGRVLLEVRQLSSRNNAIDLEILVVDNGVGMSEEVQKRLFQPFAQGEGDTTRRFGGTGLGLAITQKLLEQMSGTVTVSSELGDGSSFRVNLSLQRQVEETEASIHSLEGVEVLLYLKEPYARSIVMRYLEGADAVITMIEDETIGQLSERLQDRQTPQILIIDNNLVSAGNWPEISSLMARLPEGSRYLLLERGSRRAADQFSDWGMSLCLDAMHARTFVNTVCKMAGIEVEDHDDGEVHVVHLMDEDGLATARDEGRIILLVDDNETNQDVIRRQLNMLGYAVDVAEDGLQGLGLWRQNEYILVMTDCHMPEMDGYEMSREIRLDGDKGAMVPIIAITADALKGTAQKCREAGMNAYLTKPMQLVDIQDTLEHYIDHRPELACRNGQVQQARSVEAPDCVVDESVLPGLIGINDMAELAQYYLDFLKSNGETFEAILKAHDGADFPEIGRLGHKMKSSARTVGANALADLCGELEIAGKAGESEKLPALIEDFTRQFDLTRTWIEDYSSNMVLAG